MDQVIYDALTKVELIKVNDSPRLTEPVITIIEAGIFEAISQHWSRIGRIIILAMRVWLFLLLRR
jgi:hypothetical protein